MTHEIRWTGGKRTYEAVTIQMYLTAEEKAALERLQQLSGAGSLAETIRRALRLYGVEERDGALVCTGSRLAGR